MFCDLVGSTDLSGRLDPEELRKDLGPYGAAIEAIAAAVPRGLHLPIVYNTSAYDALDSLRLMEGLVDIYMPDFKFWTRDSAKRYVKAKDYPERARAAGPELEIVPS